MQKRLSLLNLISVVLVILINYVSQAIRINETTIGEVSNKYFNLFTPASYAFAIWGLIFISLIAYGIYQVKTAFFSKNPLNLITETGYWFIIANLLNCAWVFVFAYEFTGLSVLVMLGILFSLIKIILNTNMERQHVSNLTYIFGWLPIGLYSGWIAVATIANISAYLAKLNWEGGLLTDSGWTITMLAIATLLNLIVIYKRKMQEFAAVGIWAFIAIYIRHQNEHENIAHAALLGSIILFLAILLSIYRSRKTNLAFNSEEHSQIQ